MKNIFTFFFASVFLLSNAQIYPEHNCAKHKKERWQNFDKSNFKQLSGQEKYDLHYVKLALDVDNNSTEIYEAATTLKGNVVGVNLDVLTLELLSSLVVDSAKINGILVSTNRVGDELSLFLPSTLSTGSSFTAEVFYHGTQPNNSNYAEGIFNVTSGRWGFDVTYTLSEPFGASSWWPCKQDLTDKIDSSEVWITVPNDLKAGANGILQNVTPIGNNKHRFEWKHNHPIDFYLLSIAVADYQEYNFDVTLPTGEVIFVQNYVYDDAGLLPEFQDDIDETGDMLIEFSDKFGLYPFANEKYGHCMAPFSGGMEHQTMTSQGFFVRSLTAHELGHQWFGNNVTCATWGHIWINEGFASYTEYIFEESIDYASAQNEMLTVHNNVMQQPSGSIFVYDDTDEGRIFSSRLTYDKGSALVHMIRHWVNDDNLFFTALKTFQNTYSGSVATAEDFFAIVENTASIDLQTELQHWYYGEGYPTINLKYNNTNAGLVFELSQLSSAPNTNPFFQTALEIKCTFLNGSDTTFRVLHSYNDQQFLMGNFPPITSVEIDPNNWVLNRTGIVAKDDNLIYTSIQDNADSKHTLELYPNPNNGIFSVNSTITQDYLIYNVLGKRIEEGSLNKGMNTLDLSENKAGYYILKTNQHATPFIVQ